MFFFVLQCEGQLEKGNFFECGALSLSLSLSLSDEVKCPSQSFLSPFLSAYVRERKSAPPF